MTVMIGNRDDIVRTTTGHTIVFKKGKPTRLPNNPDVAKACADRGHAIEVKAKPAPPQPVKASEPAKKATPRRAATKDG